MNRRKALQLLPLTVGSIANLSSCSMANQNPHDRHHRGNIPESPGMSGMHPGRPETPVLHEPLAMQYQRRVREMLTWIRETQSENLLEASYAITRTVKNDGTCWFSWDMGHSRFDLFPDRVGMTDIFTMGYDTKRTKKGDLLLANIFGGSREDVVSKEVFVIGGPAPWGGDAYGSELLLENIQKLKVRPYSHIWIETNITTLGAVVNIPGMAAPFGPVSGIIGIVTYWMMIADACRILIREGIKVRVYGDEPVLSPKDESIRWAGLDEPLMDEYFNEVMKQLAMIDLEMGYITEIARMVVDTALSGGKVYCYSRYSGSLCSEADSRRGGLALTKGTHGRDKDFKGTEKDCVIMGIFKPDDEVDLERLDLFRKRGMRVASIGPMTRNISKYPSYFPLYNEAHTGSTVPRETDVHVGRMCDTYGLFAFPGLEKRVCPTSGACALQIFWVTCMEIAEEFIRRTGNVPGIYMSSALKKGKDHNHFMREQYAERGY